MESPANDDLSKKLGSFVMVFEDLNQSMLADIRTILLKNGLKNEAIQEIILSDLTAEPIRSMLQSLCAEVLNPDTEEMKILSKVFKEIQDLIKIRNEVVHSVWAEININGKKIVLTTKLKRSRNGSTTKTILTTSKLLEEYIEQARHCHWLLGGVGYCIAMDKRISDTFEKTASGEYTAKKLSDR